MTDRTTPADATVRHPVWRGRQTVDGLWLAADWLSPERRSERVLREWMPGCRAWRFEHGDVLCFEAPRMLQCEFAGGTPLRRVGAHGLYAGPLTEEERAALAAGDVHLVIGGQLQSLHFAKAQTLDPSLVIDIDDYALHDTYDGRRSLALPKAGRLTGKPLREVLGDKIPPPSQEREAFLRDAAARGAGRDASGKSIGEGFSSEKPSLRERAVGTRDRMADWLLHRFPGLSGGGAPAGGGGAANNGRGVGTGGGSVRPRNPSIVPQRWRDMLVRFAIASRASRLIGMRHGAYLRRLMEQFDRGDLHEALRNALPIDGSGESLGQAFSAPGRRDSLRLSQGNGAATSIDFGDSARDRLRKLYRNAFEQLDRQGKIDEAVFVLAELLNARNEALDYLVKHERFAQAAELALSWDMAPDLIIRLLMLAGDRERAVLVARRDNAFAAAVALLENGHPRQARQLRGEWGQALAEQGLWLAAVDAVWPDPQAREQAGRWLLAAEAAGAELSARSLVQRASLLPDTVQHYAERIARLADPASPAAPREALGRDLAEVKQSNPALRALAAQVLPALAADRAACANDIERAQFERLRKLADDPWLSADLPEWSLPTPQGRRRLWETVGALSASAPDAPGLQSPHDVAALGDGRYLVALGEAGAAVVDRNGRRVRSYAVPAYRFVMSHSGQIALAIARRDSVSRIARLDLAHHEITDLGAMPLQFFADRFDGIAWSVVSGERIMVVDAARASLDVLWSVGDLGGPVVAAEFFPVEESFLVHGDREQVLWRYRNAPQRRLLSRDPILEDGRFRQLHPAMGALPLQLTQDDDGGVRFAYTWGTRDFQMRLSPPPGELSGHGVIPLTHGCLVWLRGERAMRLHLVRPSHADVAASIDWPVAALRTREYEGGVLLFDHQGRVMDIASETSKVRVFALL
ncbi:bpX6 domain-containing protein [Lysobacter capsici]|uniref:bpX6 domain-containing protein n=1 Tax=Lysobacter capsici TaxID=435897 RepID=UPI0012FE0A0F|nr:bpX6 domain-containing protein [Lysobacter capsici]